MPAPKLFSSSKKKDPSQDSVVSAATYSDNNSVLPTSKDTPEVEDGEVKVYTKMFFQKPMSYKVACVWVFFNYLAIGLVQGYYGSFTLILQAKGITFQEQSILSLGSVPYTFKFLLSPFMDRFFVNRFGRSKTYIVSGGIVLTILFFVLAPTISYYINNLKVVPVTVLFIAVNTIVCIVQIGGESWILSMFRKEDKPKASIYMGLGQSLGVMLGSNIFVPLNDVQWLNTYIYSNPGTEPILTHAIMCFTLAIIFGGLTTVNLLFLAEERIMSSKAKDICKILMVVPRHATNSHMRKMIGYIFVNRFFVYMISTIQDNKLVSNGYLDISRSILANIDTVCYPVVFFLSYCVIYYARKGILLRMFHLNMFINVFVTALGYLTYLDLVYNRNHTRTLVFRAVLSVLNGMDFSASFLLGFYNIIVNKAVGNTGITCLITISNITITYSVTAGFELVSYLGYDFSSIACLSLQFLILVLCWPYTKVLDNKDIKLFDVSEPEKKEFAKLEETEESETKIKQ